MLENADALLTDLPFARDLRSETRERLAQCIRRRVAPAGATLISPGDRVGGVYFVTDGVVRVHYLDTAGREGTLYRLEAGDSCILSLNCVFSELSYPAWANAEDEGATLLVLAADDARELVRLDGGFLRALFEQASDRLFRLLGTLEEAIRLPLEARLARLLLDLADESGTVALPHERLAGHLGTAREVVSRLVRALVRDGVIDSGYGRIAIRDREALAARCG